MLAATFEALRARNEKALVAFVTAGDPSLNDLPAIVDALARAGADVVEVGIPFSDPIADGPVIQASSQRALDRGVTPNDVLQAVSRIRAPVPIVLMGYYNPILRRGLERFAADAKAAGAAGVIVSDLTPEESDSWNAACRSSGLDTIFLAAPTSTDARLDEVCLRSSGFVYAVSRTGVTGAGAGTGDARELVARIKARTQVPVCVGFGISTPEHVRSVCAFADGAVVGSWLVDLLHREWKQGEGSASIAHSVNLLKAATRPS